MNGARGAGRAIKKLAKAKRPKTLGRSVLPPQKHDEMHKFTDQMMQMMAQPPRAFQVENPERHLISLISNSQRAPPSLELQQFNQPTRSATDEADNQSNEDSLVPGTFVELRKNEVSTSAVVISQTVDKGILKYVCLAHSGEAWTCVLEDVAFVIPSFVPTDLASRCGMEPHSQTAIELNARVEVLKRIRAMEKVAEQALLDVQSAETDVYTTFKSSDPNKWASVTVSEVARLWKTKPTLSTVYAAHRYLMQYPLYFVASSDHARSQSFNIRPQASVDRIQTVTNWTRMKQTLIDGFVSKARSMLQSNAGTVKRSLRDVECPSWTPGKAWSEPYKTILTFIIESLRPVRGSQHDPYDLPLSYIMRKVLPEEAEITDAVVHNFLINIGVMAPWQELITGRADLSQFFGMDAVERNEKIASNAVKYLASRPPPSEPSGPMDLYTTDPLESVRHDFGDLPVYVIDDADAQELDDGVSIQPVASHPGQYWVHVHIANPSSIIPPTHAFAKEAYSRMETSYLTHITIPLLPKPLMFDDKVGLSLSDHREGPQHVLTFSTKLDIDGTVIESKVCAGYVRNVIRATYDSVNRALGYPPDIIHYPFGGKIAQPPAQPISDGARQDLSILDKISCGLVKKRFDDGICVSSKERTGVSYPSWPSQFKTPSFEGGVFCGYPEIQYTVTKTGELDIGSRAMVGEMMKLACRAASLFALERGIPTIRRISEPPTLLSDSYWQEMLKLRSPTGYIEWTDTLPYVSLEARADYSLEPREHYSLGIKDGLGYTRVTSPLRRYSDMVMHWQIASVLLNKPLAFSEGWMRSFCHHLRTTERLRKRSLGLYETFLATSYLMRWLEDPKRRKGRPDPLENLMGDIYRPPTHQTSGRRRYMTVAQLHGLGLRGVLEMDEPVHGLGDRVPVKIVSIETGVRPRIMLEVK